MSRLADRYALGFLALSLALAGGTWLLTHDPVRTLAVLIVATPCPLILAVPVAIVAGDAERATLPKDVECLTLVELGGSLEAALAAAGRLAADAAAALSRTV